MSTLQKIVAIKDDSDHWYVIPADKEKEFYRDLAVEDLIDSGEFDNKWGKYRTGGDLNNVQLWAEI